MTKFNTGEGAMKVYADNAATTYLNDVALNTLLDCLKNYNGNPNSLHTDGQVAQEKLDTPSLRPSS